MFYSGVLLRSGFGSGRPEGQRVREGILWREQSVTPPPPLF